LVIHPDPRFGFPAPLPKEVEEAIGNLDDAVRDAVGSWGYTYALTKGEDYKAALAVIKSALRPKVVSREWLVETAREITHLGGRLLDEEIPYFLKRLRELGIEVRP